MPDNELGAHSDMGDWANRSRFWLAKYEANPPKRKRRERRQHALILTGYGLIIRVDRGRLLIRDGATHFPSKPSEHEFFKGGLDLPPRIVIVDGNGSITLDAMDWLAEQSIDIVRLKYDGRIQSICATSGYSADPKKVEWQQQTRANEPARLKYAIPLITKKVAATLYNLENLLPGSPSTTKAIERAKSALSELSRSPPNNIAKLHAVEGLVAQGYFFAWRAIEIKWRATKQHPIPKEWEKFFARSSLRSAAERPFNRWATHPVNAMLNYVYGLLESNVRIQAIANGYDPRIGIMHDRISNDRHSYAFDQMEPFRPIADRAVLKLILENTFCGSDFELQSDGVVRINAQLARHLIDISSN